MGLNISTGALILSILYFITSFLEISNNQETRFISNFFLGISMICMAIEKNKSQTERENNEKN